MNILYVSAGYKPAFRQGGPILSVSAAAENLVRKGHRVIVFTTNSNVDEDLDVPLEQPVDVEGVEVWYFRRTATIPRGVNIPYLSRSIGFLYCPTMREALDRMMPGVDVVHTQGPFVYPTLAASLSARHARKPFFYSQRGALDPQRLRFRSLKKSVYIALVERRIMRRATTLIALTEQEAQSYRDLGIAVPITIVPNGIDVDDCRSGDAARAQSRWGLPPDAQVILFLARLHPIKGVSRLIDAFLRIHQEVPKAVLVLAGPDEWGMEEEIRRLVGKAGASDRVFVPGIVSGEEKKDLLARADLFCLPSEAEGFSMAILEALASETPVVISPGCYFPQVEEAGAGRVVPNNVERLAETIRSLLREPEKLRGMGKRGRQLVMRDYPWERITDRLLETYREGQERFFGSSR